LTTSVEVTVDDDDEGSLTVSTATLSVDEGGSATFTFKLGAAPSGTVRVELTSSNSAVSIDPTSLNFTLSNWQTDQTITVSAAADADSEDEEATITLDASGTGYDSVEETVTVNVTETTPGLTLSDSSSAALTELEINEGESGTFRARLRRKPPSNTTITLTSNKEEKVAFTPATLTFTTVNWETDQTVTVRTIRDTDPEDETAAVSFRTSAGGAVDGSLTVKITDDGMIGLDLSPAPPAVLEVDEGEETTFTVKLHAPPTDSLTVNLASPNADIKLSPASLTFTPSGSTIWSTAQTVTVRADHDNDSTDEDATINLTGSGVTAASVMVKITDDDKGATLEQEQAAATVILAEVVRGVLPAASGAISLRYSAARADRFATVGGQQVALDRSLAEDLAAGFAARAGVQDASKQGRYAEDSFGAERHSGEWLGGIPLDAGRPLRSADERSSGMSGASALLSDFSYALNAAGGAAGWSIWGRFDTGEFSGTNDGVEFDSSQSSIWFGADRRSDSGLLSGVAYSSSGTDADYTLGKFGAALETDLTLVLPYLETEFDSGATGRAMLGIGSGEANITQTDRKQGSADLSVYMITAGGSWPTLWEIGSAEVSWSGDFGYTALSTSGSALASLNGLSVSSMQIKGGMELAFEEMGDSWTTTPRAALLMRLDTGDGVTGTGFELTGGMNMSSSSSDRFSLDVNLRTLVMHSAEELTDWGMSIQVRIRPFGDGSGLGFGLGPHWGVPEGDGLLDRDEAFRLDEAGRRQRQLRGRERGIAADLGYGLRAFGGMLTPYSEYRFTSGSSGSIRQVAGVRFSNSDALQLSLFSERNIVRLGETRSRLAVELQKRY
ncbi:MAG: hypothetical protein ISN29_12595, partial [Gammaproteobacteria bacterium AqS3]|nr:hypothetical protein [Gammaproteobacteria bacterium AqS3]